jgi:hypothetical protein
MGERKTAEQAVEKALEGLFADGGRTAIKTRLVNHLSCLRPHLTAAQLQVLADAIHTISEIIAEGD